MLFGCSDSIYSTLLESVTLEILAVLLTRWPWIEYFVNDDLVLFALYLMATRLAGVPGGLDSCTTPSRPQAEPRKVRWSPTLHPRPHPLAHRPQRRRQEHPHQDASRSRIQAAVELPFATKPSPARPFIRSAASALGAPSRACAYSRAGGSRQCPAWTALSDAQRILRVAPGASRNEAGEAQCAAPVWISSPFSV
jgi:hypothetical protein